MQTITGAEIKDFYFNHWPEGYTHEGSEIDLDDPEGRMPFEPDDIINISKLGYLLHDDEVQRISFGDAYNAWKRKEDAPSILVFRVNPDREAEAIAAMRELGFDPIGHKKDRPQEDMSPA